MPLGWPHPKGCVKCPVLQPVAWLLLAKAVRVGPPCRGASACPSVGPLAHARDPALPAQAPISPALGVPAERWGGLEPPLCGVRQELGSDAGRAGQGGKLQAHILALWLGISQSIGCECWDSWCIPEVPVLGLEPVARGHRLSNPGVLGQQCSHRAAALCWGPTGTPAPGQSLCHRRGGSQLIPC